MDLLLTHKLYEKTGGDGGKVYDADVLYGKRNGGSNLGMGWNYNG